MRYVAVKLIGKISKVKKQVFIFKTFQSLKNITTTCVFYFVLIEYRTLKHKMLSIKNTKWVVQKVFAKHNIHRRGFFYLPVTWWCHSMKCSVMDMSSTTVSFQWLRRKALPSAFLCSRGTLILDVMSTRLVLLSSLSQSRLFPFLRLLCTLCPGDGLK